MKGKKLTIEKLEAHWSALLDIRDQLRAARSGDDRLCIGAALTKLNAACVYVQEALDHLEAADE